MEVERSEQAPANPPMSSEAIWRILVVDDQREFLDWAQSMLAGNPRLRVVGGASSGAEALALVAEVETDAVILDVQMPGMNGFETARRLIDERPGLRVLLVTASPSVGLQSLARQAGAVDCLSKMALDSKTVLKLLCDGSQ